MHFYIYLLLLAIAFAIARHRRLNLIAIYTQPYAVKDPLGIYEAVPKGQLHTKGQYIICPVGG